MPKKLILFVFIFQVLSVIVAKDVKLLPEISVSPETGTLDLNSSVKVYLRCSPPKWKNVTLQTDKYLDIKERSADKSGFFLRGKLRTDIGSFNFEERLEVNASDTLNCSWRVSSQNGIETEALYVLLTLPGKYESQSIAIGDESYRLPPFTEKHQNLKTFRNIDELVIPCESRKITISGKKLDGMIIAFPKRHSIPQKYGLRLFCSPSKGKVKESGLRFKVSVDKIKSEPLDIRMAANSPFHDRKEGDRQGGWTDQGAEKDLRSIKPGKKTLGGVDFKILDAKRNKGKSCIVLRGAARKYFPKTATIDASGKVYRQLYLLHATAWSSKNKPVGSLKASYQDGSTDNFAITSGVDVGDWAKDALLENGASIWSGSSPSFGRVYLYRTTFPLKNQGLKSIELHSDGAGPVWMITAVSASEEQVAPLAGNVRRELYQANKNWLTIDWKPMTVKKGGAIDFSNHQDAPAGKYGEVVCHGESFQFKNKPGQALRFYGNTIFHEMPFLTKKQAEIYADNLAAIGYNVMRFHCYHKGITKNDGSPELDPKGLDQFCYLLSCLKKRGIYYTFPIFGNTGWAKVIIQDPEIPEFSGKVINHELRGLVPISRPAMAYMEKLARNLLLHVNPYTGLAIKDDPALISVELLNENNIYGVCHKYPDMMKIYRRKCAAYLKKRDGLKPSKSQIKSFLPEYIVRRQEKGTSELKAFLREIGVNKPITDISQGKNLTLELTRQHLDYVDIHAYWDLAEGIPTRLHMMNPIAGKWQSQLLAGAGRLFGKPFAQGEYNTVYPSPYWHYMGPSEAAIAGLQNWSMIIGCGLNSFVKSNFEPAPSYGIKSSNPMILLTERIGSLLYLPGEVKASRIKVPFVLSRDYILRCASAKGGPSYPNAYLVLGLCRQIGTIIYDDETNLSSYPFVVVPDDMKIKGPLKKVKCLVADAKLADKLRKEVPEYGKTVFRGTTGETELDSATKTFKIITPRAECLMGPSGRKKLIGKNVTVSGLETNVTCFVGSLDKKPLIKSKRLLAIFVTDLKNTDTVMLYEKSGGAIFQEKGRMPFLLKQATATFTVKSENPSPPTVWALKYDGSRSCKVKATKTSDGFSFPAKAVTSKDTYFAYEIVWD